MSSFNLHKQHNLIPNANTYVSDKKFVSINSEDRDSTKFPDASLFEIELPQDYCNVQSVQLSSWSFPANYDVFAPGIDNLTMIFKMENIYNPKDHGVKDSLLEAIFAGLTASNELLVTIETGFYNPAQMSVELTNRLNESVTKYLKIFFETTPAYNYAEKLFNEYNDFVVTYNSVSQRLLFGNTSSGFIFVNNSDYYRLQRTARNGFCFVTPRALPEFTSWGLPAYLGFTRIPEVAKAYSNYKEVRLYYNVGTSGYWLRPNLPGASVYVITPPLKINFMGPSYFYMELDTTTSLNCIDETNPYNLTTFTKETNQTNGRVNSAFAKIAIPTTPISQWYDTNQPAYKWFDPPAEKIRRLRVKIRYHNGILVDFASFNYSFMLEFNLLSPQIQRKSKIMSTDPSSF